MISYRFMGLSYQSPWIDEISTLIDANPNLSYQELFVRITKSQVHPPLYFFLIHLFFKTFGFSIDVLRFFSALISIFTFLTLYIYVKNFFNITAAKISLLFLSINLCFIGFSQEGRSYTFFIFLQLVSFYFLNKYYKNSNIWNLIFLTLFNISLLYTNYFAVFIVASQAISVLLFLVKRKEKEVIYLAISYFFVAISFIPWIPYTSEGTKFIDSWIKTPNLTEILRFGINSMFPNLTLKIIILVSFIISLKKLFSSSFFEYSILWIWIIGFLLFSYLFSLFFTPILAWKYLVFILLPIIIICSVGITQVSYQLIKYLIVFIFTIISLYVNYYKYPSIFYPVKSEYAGYIDFMKEADLNLPVIVNEKNIVDWFANHHNLNLGIFQVRSVVQNLSLHRNLLSNGWWELHLHRPFFTDSIVNKIAEGDSLSHFRHTNFSSIDLWIPTRLTLPITETHHKKDSIFYQLNNFSAKRVKVFLSISSRLPHYSDHRLKISLGGNSQSLRLNYKKGIYSVRFLPKKGKLLITLQDNDIGEPVLSNITVDDIIVVNDD